MAQNETDDLPDVPDTSDDGDNQVAPAASDDEAVRQIRRRISPVGWLLILAALGGGGATAYYIVQSAQRDALEDSERDRGRAELNTILQQNLPREETARRVRELYGRYQSEGVKSACRRILAGLRDPAAVPMLIEGLAHAGAPRAQAALGLAEIGSPAADSAKATLLRILPTTDPQTDRIEVAWALVVLNEPAAWDTVRQLLESGRLQTVTGLDQRHIFDPAPVARMAGRQHLHELVTARPVVSRRLAAIALTEIASPDVVDDLALLSRDSDESVAREAALGLGRTGDPRAGQAILDFLNAHPDARSSVLTALATSAGAQGLSPIITGSRDLATRAQATQLLREQADPDGGDGLFAALQAATGTDDTSLRMKRNAIFGLAEIGDPRAVDGLMTYATHALTHLDPNSTQEAKLALEQIRRIPGAAARAKDGLLAILRDPHGDFVRTPTIMALAMAGDPTVATGVLPFLTQPDAQEGATMAVCTLRHAACFTTVLAQVRQPAGLRMAEETVRDEEVLIRRRSAIRALAWAAYEPGATAGTPPPSAPALTPAQRTSMVRELRRIVEDATDRRSLREEAGYALASVADDAAIEEMARRATDASVAEESRIFYIYALRGRATAAIATQLVQTYLRRGVNPDVMKGAAIAAGFSADDRTSEVLVPLLRMTDPQDANVRYAAGIATVLGGNAAAVSVLIDQLSASDELNGTLQNEFAPRASGAPGNNSVVSENPALLPLTRAMFTDGRIFRRIENAALLDAGRAGKHFGWAMSQVIQRLRAGWDSAQGVGPYEVRRLLREAALGDQDLRRDMALRAFRTLLDRGSLHALRRQTRVPAASERARRELLEMGGGANNNAGGGR